MTAYCTMIQSHRWLRILLGSLFLVASAGTPAATHAAADIILYDGSLGGLPDTQGMIYQSIGIGLTQSFAAGVTTLSSSVNAFQGGYTPQVSLVPTLDRTRGFSIRSTLQLTTEEHAGSDKNGDAIDDRAGFSIIALASDLHGIELGFWPNRIWAQAGGGLGDGPIFTQAEGVNLDTSIERNYTLNIHGNSYTLSADGTIVLSGVLRDYSSFGLVYTTPNFIFLGDDTTSASATIRIRTLSMALNDYQIALPLVTKD